MTDGVADHVPRVEQAQSVAFVLQPPGQQDGRGHLIQLHAWPVGVAVDPGVLREAAILPWMVLSQIRARNGVLCCPVASSALALCTRSRVHTR